MIIKNMTNTLNNKLDGRRSLMICAIILSIINLIAFTVLQTPLFDTMDDPMMAMLVENASGNSHGVILFSNIAYSKLLQVLYSIIPAVKWYTIVQIGAIFLSSLSITYIIYKKFKFVIGTIINIIMSFYTGFLFYYAFQFTKTAAICAVAGILVVFDSFHSKSKRNKWLKIVFGSLLILLSSWIRFNSLGMTAIVMSSIGICIIIDILKQKTQAKEKARAILNYILVFALAFGISVPTYIINYNFYKDNEYYQYNGYRAELQDFGFPDYDKNVELYESLGISNTDYFYFYNWNIDLDVLTFENIKTLAESKGKHDISYFFSDEFFDNLIDYVLLNETFIILFALMIIFVLLNRKRWYYYVSSFAFMAGVQVYLDFIGRVGWRRISTSLFFAVICAFIYSFDELNIQKIQSKFNFSKGFSKKLVCSVLAAICAVYAFLIAYSPAKVDSEQVDKLTQFYDLVSDDKDNLYLYVLDMRYHDEGKLTSVIETVDFYKPMKANQTDNIYQMGCWDCNSASNLSILDKYNVENPYRDCIDNENAVFLSQAPFNREMLVKYINNHYHPNAQIDLVKTINGYKQWRIITHEYDLSNAVIQPADNSVISNVTVEKSNDTIKITGEAYKIGFDSYKQRCFAVITSSIGEQHTYEVNLTDNGNDRYSGGYSTLNDKYKAANADEATVCVIMQTGDMYYRVY